MTTILAVEPTLARMPAGQEVPAELAVDDAQRLEHGGCHLEGERALVVEGRARFTVGM